MSGYVHEIKWPQWKPLGRLQKLRATRLMVGDRSPVEAFLSAEPPREIEIRQSFAQEIYPLIDDFRPVIEDWSATRCWVFGSEVIPEREGPIWEIDVVFYVDETPVIANFKDESDKMHGVGGAAVHDRWLGSLMQSTGTAATVLFDRTGNCLLFGDLHPYIFWSFEETLQLAMETEALEERRELVDICLWIVNDLENESLAWDAVSRSGRPVAYDSPGDWCRTGFTENRLGTDLRPHLQRMLPVLTRAGKWMWAAS
jgi:hypothetical protein